MNQRIITVCLLSSTIGFMGCDQSKPQPPLAPPKPAARTSASTEHSSPTTTPAVPAASDSSRTVALLGVSLTLPETWERHPPANQMRLAEAEVPSPNGDPASVCQVVFSTAGGSVQENLNRWTRQVSDGQGGAAPSKIEKRTVSAVSVSVMESTGFFQGMGDAAPRPDWGLKGAVIEAPEGLLFVKMTGPASSIAAAAPAFDAMIGTITTP